MKLFKGVVIDAAEDFSLILNVTFFRLKMQLNWKQSFAPLEVKMWKKPTLNALADFLCMIMLSFLPQEMNVFPSEC